MKLAHKNAEFYNPKTKMNGIKPTAVYDVLPYKEYPENGGGGVDKSLLKAEYIGEEYPEVAGPDAPNVQSSIKRLAAEEITGHPEA